MIIIRIFSFLLLATLSSHAFAKTKQTLPIKDTSIKQFRQKDTSYWVDNFRQFRDALYLRDKSKTKVFFDFPIINGKNEIWYLAHSGDDNSPEKLDSISKPFTEKDLDKYFDNIFSKLFIRCFIKIKTDDLYRKGESESPELKDSTGTYVLYATFNKKNRVIELNFAIKKHYKISDSEYEPVESNFIYYFKILPKGHIKFKKVLIAG